HGHSTYSRIRLMRVFISYHTPDDAKARAVEATLTLHRPGTECYLAPRSNIAGAYWLPRLADEITASDVVLFLAGTRIGPWQELEYYEALRLSRGRDRPAAPGANCHGPSGAGIAFFRPAASDIRRRTGRAGALQRDRARARREHSRWREPLARR